MAIENKTPYFRFFASDWLAGTRGLKADETGVYITLLALMYERTTPVPFGDADKLARMCGIGKTRFDRIISALLDDGKLIVTDGGLWNRRVGKEFGWREKNSEDAKRAAQSRWQKDKEINETPMHPQSIGNADAMPIQKPEARDIKKEPAVPKKGSRIPDDFRPDLEWSQRQGLSNAELKFEFEQFKDFWTAKTGKDATKADWQATWRTWIRNTLKRRSKPKGETVGQYAYRNMKEDRDHGTGNHRPAGLFDEGDAGANQAGFSLLVDLANGKD